MTKKGKEVKRYPVMLSEEEVEYIRFLIGNDTDLVFPPRFPIGESVLKQIKKTVEITIFASE